MGGRRARRALSPTTRSSGPRSAAGTARRTAPAASRAGCRTASRSSSRGALKPISTLTKPLRSVDTETKEPAQALRERTDSTVVPAAGVVGEAMVALVLAALLPREVRRRPHRRRARARSPPTGSGSGGGGRGDPPSRRRSSSSASWARGRRSAASAAASGRHRGDRRRRAARGASSACRSRGSSATTGEEEFRSLEEAEVGQLLEDADGGAIALGGGAVGSERVRRALGRHVVGMASGLRRGGLATRRGAGAAAGAGPRAVRGACTRSASRSTSELADAILPAGDQGMVARALPSLRGLLEMRAGYADGVGAQRVGRVPGVRRRGLLAAAFWPLEGRRFCVTDTVGLRALFADSIQPLAGLVEVEPGEGAKTLAEAERVLRELARLGVSRPTTWSRSAAGWSATSPASAPPPTSAGWRWCRCRRRWSPRSTPPTAARRASTCPRPRTTSAPTTCRAAVLADTRHACASLPREEMAAGFVEVREDRA